MKLSKPQKSPGIRGERKTPILYRNLLTEQLRGLAEKDINYKYNQMASQLGYHLFRHLRNGALVVVTMLICGL
jgi:hypothetical protein